MKRATVKRFNLKKTFPGRTVKRTSVVSQYAHVKKRGRKLRPLRKRR